MERRPSQNHCQPLPLYSICQSVVGNSLFQQPNHCVCLSIDILANGRKVERPPIGLLYIIKAQYLYLLGNGNLEVNPKRVKRANRHQIGRAKQTVNSTEDGAVCFIDSDARIFIALILGIKNFGR